MQSASSKNSTEDGSSTKHSGGKDAPISSKASPKLSSQSLSTTKQGTLTSLPERKLRFISQRKCPHLLAFTNRRRLETILWKSFIVRSVHWIGTLIEIFLPIVVIYLATNYLEPLVKPNLTVLDRNETMPEKIYKDPLYQFPMNGTLKNFRLPFYLFYVNNKSQPVHTLMSQVFGNKKNTPFDDKSKMYKSLLQTYRAIDEFSKDNSELPLYAIQFEQVDFDKGKLSYHLVHYLKIKTKLELLYQAYEKKPAGNRLAPSNDVTFSYYMGVVCAIYEINRVFLAQVCQKHQCHKTNPAISKLIQSYPVDIHRMPYPRYPKYGSVKEDNDLTFLSQALDIYDTLALCVLLIMTISPTFIASQVVAEKSSHMKHLLSMLGLPDHIYWFGHFCNYFQVHLVQSVVLTWLFFGPPAIYIYSNWFVFLCSYTIYGVQLILFTLFFTTIFNRPLVAVIAMIMFWLFSSLAIFFMLAPSFNKDGKISTKIGVWPYLATSMLPTGSLLWIISLMGEFEKAFVGLNFANLAVTTRAYKSINFLMVLAVVIFSCVVYAFLIWYLDKVWPWQASGVPKHPLFFLKSKRMAEKPGKPEKSKVPRSDNEEPEPTNVEPIIRMTNVRKEYLGGFFTNSEKKVAVEHVSLNIYPEQCTVLLGHNGAGKTTVFSMLVGIIPPTEGEILIDGIDVNGALGEQVRGVVGVCPQKNIFFPELTVSQHLLMFSMLRAPHNSWQATRLEAKKLLKMLHLGKKGNVRTNQLSGGMMRKLQLAMAMIGNTKVLVLDEPTSGMDPENRRIIWNVLLKVRRSRTILITTHFMEEADALADRIVIINAGLVQCSGSSMFLKRTFGAGYILRISKAKGFNDTEFQKLLKEFAPTAFVYRESSTEVAYSLSGHKALKLVELAQEIEKNGEQLGIDSFGLSYTSLEDVFLKVGAEVLNKEGAEDQSELTFGEGSVQWSPPFVNKLIHQQLTGLILKRFHFARRYPPVFVFQLLLPAVILAVAIVVDHSIRSMITHLSASKSSGIKFNLNLKDLYGGDMEVFVKGNGSGGDLADLTDMWKQIHANLYEAKASSLVTPSVNEWALQRAADTNIGYYSIGVLYGLEVATKKLILWFNSEATHSMVLSVINLFEAMLHVILKASTHPQSPYIRIANEPRWHEPAGSPKNSQDSSATFLAEISDRLIVMLGVNLGLWALLSLIMLPVALTFLGASYILFPIHEIQSKSKHLQLMTGLPLWLFWLGNLLFDLLVHCVSIAILTLVIVTFDRDEAVFGDERILSFTLMMFLFGLSAITFAYLLAPIFGSPNKGFTTLVIVYIAIALLLSTGVTLYDFVEFLKESYHFSLGLTLTFPVLHSLPIFSFLFGFQRITRWAVFSTICRELIPSDNRHLEQFVHNMSMQLEEKWPADEPRLLDPQIILFGLLRGCFPNLCGDRCYRRGILWNLTYGPWLQMFYMILWAAVFFVLLLYQDRLIEGLWRKLARNFQRLKRKLTPACLVKNTEEEGMKMQAQIENNFKLEDSDVKRERERIAQAQNLQDLLVVDNLTKKYDNGHLAVNKIMFGVQYDEVFGLLGVNGAGKTSLFSMLTGVLKPSAGDALLQRGTISLLKQTRKFQQSLGYCPQFDAFLEQLNAYETLALFARLRGVVKVHKEVDECIELIGLERATAHRQVETYSGGNRRKLSIGMAIIGSPSLLLLDEPTTGVDPAARRKIWSALQAVRKRSHCSMILTSHSMDECEELCTRLAIMVNGHFRCFGSTQHLRSVYGQGFYIMIKLLSTTNAKDAIYQQVMIDMALKFPGIKLKDAHQTLMLYHLGDATARWSSLFSRMEEMKASLKCIEDYVVSGTTLEQIFLLFVRLQARVEQ